MNSKGNAISDSLVLIISVFAMAILFGYSYQAFDDIKPTLDSEITNTEATAVYTDLHSRMPQTLDAAIITLIAFMWAGALALSFFIDTHPAFFVLNIVLLIGILIVGMFLSNSYAETLGADGLDTAFPMTTFVFENLLSFVFAIATSIMIALYAKTRL